MENDICRMYMEIYATLIKYLKVNGLASFAAYISDMVETTRKDAEKARKNRKHEKALDLMYCLALYRGVQDFIIGASLDSAYGCINNTGKAPNNELVERYLSDEYEYNYAQFDDSQATWRFLGY